MATKKRSTPKQATPKRITPDSRATPYLSLDRKDKALLINHLRERFHKIFTRPLGFTFDFRDGKEALAFTSHYRLADERPKSNSFRKYLQGLGIAPGLTKMAVETYEYQSKKRFPKLEHARYDLWFWTLRREFAGEKLKGIIAATPESLAKWDKRLKKCERSWANFALPDNATIEITEKLFRDVLDQPDKGSAIRERLRRWKNNPKRILHGRVGVSFTFGWK